MNKENRMSILDKDLRRKKLMKLNPAGEVRELGTDNRVMKPTYKERGEWLITYQQPLCFGGGFVNAYTSISTFIKDFWSNNDKYPTLNLITNKISCEGGRRRSLGDIFLITRSYFPKVGLETVIKELITNPAISTNLCALTRKNVFYIRANEPQRHAHPSSKDEYNISIAEYQAQFK